MRIVAAGLALGIVMVSAPAWADECEALAAGIAAATHLPAQPSGRQTFEFDMLGIHSRMYLFCDAPQIRISTRDYAERIPAPDLMTMAAIAAAQFAGSAPDKAYSVITGCIQRALRDSDGLANGESAPVDVGCIVTKDSSQIDVYATGDH